MRSYLPYRPVATSVPMHIMNTCIFARTKNCLAIVLFSCRFFRRRLVLFAWQEEVGSVSRRVGDLEQQPHAKCKLAPTSIAPRIPRMPKRNPPRETAFQAVFSLRIRTGIRSVRNARQNIRRRQTIGLEANAYVNKRKQMSAEEKLFFKFLFRLIFV